MNKVMKKCVDLQEVIGYASPEMKIVLFQPEGVLCTSGMTEQFKEEDLSNNFWD